MRICLSCRALQDHFIAGIGYYIHYLIQNLAKIDKKNQYILLYNSFRKTFLEGVPEYNYDNFNRVMFRIPNVFLSGIAGTAFSKIIPAEKLTGNVDVFHATNFLLPYCQHAKSIVTIYDLSILKYKQFHPLKRRLVFSKSKLLNSIKSANAIITCSQATKNDIVDILNIPAEKIKVIYGAISPEFKAASDKTLTGNILKKYSLPDKYIVYVGTLEPRKNIASLINAFRSLKEKIKDEYKLVMIGGKGWYYKDIFHTIKRLNLNSDVMHLGYVPREDLPVIVNAANAFVYPSLYEGFGLPPLEAMASGVPTLVSNISCFPEIVKDAALKVNPYSVSDIADGIYKILTDKTLRDDLKEKGLARVKDFSWEKAARETLSLYEDVHLGKYS